MSFEKEILNLSGEVFIKISCDPKITTFQKYIDYFFDLIFEKSNNKHFKIIYLTEIIYISYDRKFKKSQDLIDLSCQEFQLNNLNIMLLNYSDDLSFYLTELRNFIVIDSIPKEFNSNLEIVYIALNNSMYFKYINILGIDENNLDYLKFIFDFIILYNGKINILENISIIKFIKRLDFYYNYTNFYNNETNKYYLYKDFVLKLLNLNKNYIKNLQFIGPKLKKDNDIIELTIKKNINLKKYFYESEYFYDFFN